MRSWLVALALTLGLGSAQAQVTSNQVLTSIATNLAGPDITAAQLRTVLTLMNTATFQPFSTLPVFTAGISSVPAVPGTVISNPGQYNCFIGSTIYCGNTSFINTMAPGFLSAGVSNITAGAPSGGIAAILGTQCSQNAGGGGFASCGEALAVLTYADTVVCPVSGCANQAGVLVQYNQATLLASSDPVALGGGRIYGASLAELSASSLWGYVTGTDPYNFNATGTVLGIRVDCGVGAGGTNDCGGFAYEVVPNPKAFTGGYLCGNGSLVAQTIVAIASLGPCMSMAQNQGMFWYSAAATSVAGVWASSTSLHSSIASGNSFVWDAAGSNILQMDGTIGSAEMFPGATNIFSMGISARRWSNVFSVLGNFSGNVTYSGALLSSGTPPTGNTGTCSTGVTVTGGATAGTWTSTNACALAGTIILTGMPTATTGYSCWMVDRTTSGVTAEQTATSVTSATFTIRALPTGSVQASANDIIQYGCVAY